MDKERYTDIIKENNRRNKDLMREYNPITGVGSPVPRFKLFIDSENFMLLPMKMKKCDLVAEIILCGSVESYTIKKNESAKEEVLYLLLRWRMEYDFEYWCACCVKIQDKLSKKIIPFIMRRPQLKLFMLLYNMMVSEKPIRVIVLKARQWGGSTLVQIFMSWIQLFHRTGWHSVIVADVEDQARNIKSMYSRLAQYHPTEVMPVIFGSFEGSA